MASISLGQWNAYNTSYGCYNTYFEYDGTSRSGTTITVTNASVYCVRVGTGYTTNRGATSGSIGGQNGWSNAQLWASGTQSPATCRYTRGTVNVTGVDYTTSTISVNVQCRGASASNWNTIYGTVQLNSTFNISVPVINPPSYNSIASSSVTTNSAYLSASVNTNGVSITGGGWDISTDGGSTWTYHDGNPTGATISGLTPGTKYWYRGYVTTEAGGANSGWGYFRTLQDSVAIVNPLIENLDNNDCSLSVYSSPFYGMDRAVLDIYDENKSQIVGNCGIRYIKIGSEGSTTNAWNHIVECYVYANFLKGQKIAGVTVGGDYTGYIAVNSNNGTDNSNVGEFYTYAGTFTHPNGNTFVQSSNYEVNSNFEGSTPAIDGFLMFIGSDISRFSSVLHPGASFVVAKYFSGQWYYNTNTTWVAFTPNINDAICGSVYFYPEIADGRMVYTSFLGTNNKVLALVSIGKDVTSNNTQSATYVWSRVTDGITATATYADVGTRTTIDLETEYPIEKVILWRYYNDRRLYYKTFVKGYDENDNLQAVFHDYRTDGEYREGDDGEDLPAYTRHISSLEPNTQYWAKFQLRARGTSNWSSEFWRPFVTKPNRIDVVNPQVNNLAEDGGTLQAQSTDYETTDLVSYAIISGKNLFNKNNVKLNTYVDSTTGLEVSPIIKILNKYDLESGNYTGTTGEDITTARPQRVRIPFNKMINIKGASYINISLENPGVMWIEKYTFLDANYSYISGVDPVNSSGTGNITPPANAVYLRICFRNQTNTDITVQEVVNAKPKIFYSSASATAYVCAGGYMPIEPDTDYVETGKNGWYTCAFYDVNKNFISRPVSTDMGSYRLYHTPVNAYFARTMCPIASLNTCQFEKGSTGTTYEEQNIVQGAYIESTISKNLFNGNFINGFIDLTTGEITTYAGYPDSKYSDLIEVEYGQDYICSGQLNEMRFREFDENYNYLGSYTSTGGYYTPSSIYVKYVRALWYLGLTTQEMENMQIENNSSATSYVTYSTMTEYLKTISGLNPLTEYRAQFLLRTDRTQEWSPEQSVLFTTLEIPDDYCKFIYENGTTSEYKKMYAISGKNLFDERQSLQDTYINGSTGELTTLSGTRTTELISCYPSTDYMLSGTHNRGSIAFYDINEDYISVIDNGTIETNVGFTTPSNCYYFRVYYDRDGTSANVQIEQGSVATQYEPYIKEISKYKLHLIS